MTAWFDSSPERVDQELQDAARSQLVALCERYPGSAEAMLAAIRAGKISSTDPSLTEDGCGCLTVWVGISQGVNMNSHRFDAGSESGEFWIAMERQFRIVALEHYLMVTDCDPGQTPANNSWMARLEGWIMVWQESR